MAKSGKMRSLIRELRTQYTDAAAEKYLKPNSVSTTLQMYICECSLFFLRPSPNRFIIPLWLVRCAVSLEAELKKIDGQYDLCNEAWAKGEAENFWGEGLPDINT